MSTPKDIVAEAAVLATLALKPALADDIKARLPEPECFFDRRHRALYQALLSLAGRSEPVDFVTIHGELLQLGLLREFRSRDDVQEYVRRICEDLPRQHRDTGVSILAQYESYCGFVHQHWVARSLQMQLAQVSELAGLPQQSVAQLINQLQREGNRLLGLADRRPTISHGEAIQRVLEDAVDRQVALQKMTDGAMLGLPLGIPGLTAMTGGLRPGTLTIAGGAAGWGKSTLMMQMVAEIAATAPARAGEGKGGAAVISVEMSALELAAKPLLAAASVDNRRVLSGELADDELERVSSQVASQANLRVFYDRLNAPTWPEVRGRMILAVERFGVECLVLDYVQKLRRPARVEKKDHVQEVAEGLKELAEQMNVAVVAMAQLTRAAAAKARKSPPVMQDLGDSSGLEKEADLIILLHPRGARTESSESLMDRMAAGFTHVREICHVIVAKNRFGNTGTVETEFNKSLGRFDPPPKPDERSFRSADGVGLDRKAVAQKPPEPNPFDTETKYE